MFYIQNPHETDSVNFTRQTSLCTGLDRPLGLQEFETVRTSRQAAYEDGKDESPKFRPPLSSKRDHVTHFCRRLSPLQGGSAARRIISIKNSSDTIGKGTNDFPLCFAVPCYYVVSLLRSTSTHKRQIRGLGRYVEKALTKEETCQYPTLCDP